MKRWLTDPTISIATNGDFERWDLTLISEKNQLEFLREFGRRVVSAYLAPLRVMPLLALPLGSLSLPQITKRLFDSSGNVSEIFLRFAGEVLAAWAEESYTSREIARPPKPHDSTPAFDIITIEREDNRLYVYFLQAKTTESNIHHNANDAVQKLGKLERGDYYVELAAVLEEIAARRASYWEKRAILKALYDRSVRRYRIVVTHGDTPPARVLTKFDEHVRGDRVRRAANFFQLPDWGNAWRTIGEGAIAEASS